MTTCKQCGNTYDESYGVCPKCGRPCEQELTKNNVYVPPMPAPMQTLTPKKKNSKAKLITILSIAGVVLVGLIIALVMIFSQPDVQEQVKEQLSLGEKYLLEEDYDEAIVAFKKAIDIQPNNPELYMKLSDAYIAKGDTENAIKALEDGYAKTNSEDIKKKLDELKLNLQYAKYIEDGNAALSNNEYNTAIENFENAVALKPQEVEPYISAADGYIGNSDNDGAIAILEKGYKTTQADKIKEKIEEINISVNNEYKEKFIEALLQNEDEWTVEEWFISGGNAGGSYYFDDLDLDGKLEFVVDTIQGSGHFKAVTVYNLGSDNRINKAGSYAGYGKIYYDTVQSKSKLIFSNHNSGGNGYYSESMGTVFYDGSTISSEISVRLNHDVNLSTQEEIYTYYDGNDNVISENEYEKIKEELTKNCIDINAKSESIYCGDWVDYSDKKKKSALEKAYDSFTYDDSVITTVTENQ